MSNGTDVPKETAPSTVAQRIPVPSDAAILEALDSFRETQLRLENKWLHQQLEEMKRQMRKALAVMRNN